MFQVYEQDGLPNMICHPCKYQLEKSYQFRKKCQAADAKLRKHMKLIQQLTGQDEESENQDSNRDESKESSTGKSKQVKQLLADLVSTKGESGQIDGNPIEVTEEELVGGYILGVCYRKGVCFVASQDVLYGQKFLLISLHCIFIRRNCSISILEARI